MSPSPMQFADPVLDERTQQDTAPDLPWVCVCWDDPVNLMSYVVYVFRTVLGFSAAQARELMMQVHKDGKAIVSTGDRDSVEADAKKLQAAGLWATIQRADSSS